MIVGTKSGRDANETLLQSVSQHNSIRGLSDAMRNIPSKIHQAGNKRLRILERFEKFTDPNTLVVSDIESLIPRYEVKSNLFLALVEELRLHYAVWQEEPRQSCHCGRLIAEHRQRPPLVAVMNRLGRPLVLLVWLVFGV